MPALAPSAPLLLTPGPVPLSEVVQAALTQPVIHHRTAAFERFYQGLLEDARYLFQTEQQTCCVIGSGTYGVEMCMRSLFRTGETVCIGENGKFSQRWTAYARHLGLRAQAVLRPWGEAIPTEAILEALTPQTRGLILTHCETSTGACLDLEEVVYAAKTRYPHLLVVVDGITSVGALPFYSDAWQVDAAVVAAQKALMNPAGTALIALSEAACASLVPTDASDFTNLHHYVHHAQRGSYPYTPPVSLLYGLKAALEHIRHVGLPAIWRQSHEASREFKRGVLALGGQVWGGTPSDSLTAFDLPEVSMDRIRESLERDHGMVLAGGQGELKGRIARISHMGSTGVEAARHCLGALEEILDKTP